MANIRKERNYQTNYSSFQKHNKAKQTESNNKEGSDKYSLSEIFQKIKIESARHQKLILYEEKKK